MFDDERCVGTRPFACFHAVNLASPCMQMIFHACSYNPLLACLLNVFQIQECIIKRFTCADICPSTHLHSGLLSELLGRSLTSSSTEQPLLRLPLDGHKLAKHTSQAPCMPRVHLTQA